MSAIETIDQSVGSVAAATDPSRILGTAFVISDREAITAAHVLQAAEPSTDLFYVSFPGSKGRFEFFAAVEDIDVLQDVAVLTRAKACKFPEKLPAPLLVAGTCNWPRQRDIVGWEATGYPPAINASRHHVTGLVTGRTMSISKTAEVLQLRVHQQGLRNFGGMSGAPVVVNGRVVALIREYPGGVLEGTIYASVLDQAIGLRAIGEAFDRSKFIASDDLKAQRDLQMDLLTNIRPRRIHGMRAPKQDIFIEPILLDEQSGGKVSFRELLRSSKARGTVILGDAGAGKTTILTELARKLLCDPGALGETQLTTPLLLLANQLQNEELMKSLVRGSAESDSLRRMLDEGATPWLIFVDGIDRKLATEEGADLISIFLTKLDAFCSRRGYSWVASCLNTGAASFKMPKNTQVLRILPWSREVAQDYLTRSYGDEGNAIFARLASMAHSILLETPLLLSAAAGLARLNTSLARTPMETLDGFLQDVMERASQYASSEGTSPQWRRVTTEVGLHWLVCKLAEASVGENLPVDVAAAALETRCNFRMGEAWHVTRALVSGPIQQCGVVTLLHDGSLQWAHDLYRDSLAATSLLDQYTSLTMDETWRRALLKRAQSEPWRRVVALMLARLSSTREVTRELADLDLAREKAFPLIVDYVALGGRLDNAHVELLVTRLTDWLNREKHSGDDDSALFADVFGFSPLDALLSLAFLPAAQHALMALRVDLYLPQRWRYLIDARL